MALTPTVLLRMMCISISRANLRQTRASVGATAIAKVMSTVTFQMETVATVVGENASPSLLDRTVMVSKITKCAVVTTYSTRTGAKPISRAGRVFKIRATATMKWLLLSETSPKFFLVLGQCAKPSY